jgi:hypothetical protein
LPWLVDRQPPESVEYQHVPGCGKPVEIGEAVVPCIPVCPKYSGKRNPRAISRKNSDRVPA